MKNCLKKEETCKCLHEQIFRLESNRIIFIYVLPLILLVLFFRAYIGDYNRAIGEMINVVEHNGIFELVENKICKRKSVVGNHLLIQCNDINYETTFSAVENLNSRRIKACFVDGKISDNVEYINDKRILSMYEISVLDNESNKTAYDYYERIEQIKNDKEEYVLISIFIVMLMISIFVIIDKNYILESYKEIKYPIDKNIARKYYENIQASKYRRNIELFIVGLLATFFFERFVTAYVVATMIIILTIMGLGMVSFKSNTEIDLFTIKLEKILNE